MLSSFWQVVALFFVCSTSMLVFQTASSHFSWPPNQIVKRKRPIETLGILSVFGGRGLLR